MMNGTMTRHFITACASAFAIAAASMPAAAYAQNEDQRDFEIAAGPLAPALSRFASETGLSLVYPASLAEGRSTKGANGNVSPQAALAQLLSGTGLTFRFSDARTVVVEPLPASGENGERVLGAVRVEGSQGASLPGATSVNGINGSRDVTATEGTGSYTSNALTVGSKMPASLKDTPMTVSVLSQQRLEDQAISDFRSALEQAPGVSIQTRGENFTQHFYSRGYEIKTVQIDGGAGLQLYQGDSAGGIGVRPLLDMALYDHVEVLRGAAGTFNGYGDPGGVVNLVRKKPLDHEQLLLELQAGSWQKYRVVADLTGPLAFEGKLRGRAVLTAQSNHYFYDTAKDLKEIAYGILEYDLTSSTLLSVGGSYQRQDSVPWGSGLVRYSNGDDLGLPRSTCLCWPFAKANTRNNEIFGQIDQKIGADWTVKLKATRLKQMGYYDVPGIYGFGLYTRAVDPVTKMGPRTGSATLQKPIYRQNLFEATLDGSFTALGNVQKISLGANTSISNNKGSTNYTRFGLVDGVDYNVPINVFDFDKYLLDGSFPPRELARIDVGGRNVYTTIYLNANLTPIDRFHVVTGLRYTRYYNRRGGRDICTHSRVSDGICAANDIGKIIEDNSNGTFERSKNFSWPPSVSLQYDITNNLTGYVTYSDIYQPVTALLRDGSPADPITGTNIEGGLKWSPHDGRLNVSLSGFHTRQTAYPLRVCDDPTTPCGNQGGSDGYFNEQRDCCYVNNPNGGSLSYGLDLEITGEVLPNFQISGGYTYNYQKLEDNFNDDGQPLPLQTLSPRHLLKFWGTYRFPKESKLSGLLVGGGFNAQSKTYVTGDVCRAYLVLTPTFALCTDSYHLDFSDPGRFVFSANLQYDISDKLNLSVNIENLFDKTYYQTVGDIGGGNWYGAPRSFTLSLRAKW